MRRWGSRWILTEFCPDKAAVGETIFGVLIEQGVILIHAGYHAGSAADTQFRIKDNLLVYMTHSNKPPIMPSPLRTGRTCIRDNRKQDRNAPERAAR